MIASTHSYLFLHLLSHTYSSVIFSYGDVNGTITCGASTSDLYGYIEEGAYCPGSKIEQYLKWVPVGRLWRLVAVGDGWRHAACLDCLCTLQAGAVDSTSRTLHLLSTFSTAPPMHCPSLYRGRACNAHLHSTADAGAGRTVLLSAPGTPSAPWLLGRLASG